MNKSRVILFITLIVSVSAGILIASTREQISVLTSRKTPLDQQKRAVEEPRKSKYKPKAEDVSKLRKRKVSKLGEMTPTRDHTSQTEETARTRIKSDLSWFFEPQFNREYSISDPRYDSILIDEALNQRDHANPWRESTFKEFQLDLPFSASIRSLTTPRDEIRFSLKLEHTDYNAYLYPNWIEYTRGKSKARLEYLSFKSRYKDEEPHVGLLAFPYDSFWKSIDPDRNCDEIAIICDGILSHEEKNHVTGFDGRVFCRQGLKKLFGIAHFSARIDGDPEWR